MPELARLCTELYGIDVHDKAEHVQQILEQEGIKTNLCSGSIERTSFPSHYFDYVIAVSALEFVQDIHAASAEIHRILKQDGFLIVVTPGHSKILDLGLELLTGESAKRDYGNRREGLPVALAEQFSLSASSSMPPIIGRLVPLYSCLKLRPR
jgi:ubiquinone/menaquinone biosynthesis C-methylase UbiE